MGEAHSPSMIVTHQQSLEFLILLRFFNQRLIYHFEIYNIFISSDKRPGGELFEVLSKYFGNSFVLIF